MLAAAQRLRRSKSPAPQTPGLHRETTMATGPSSSATPYLLGLEPNIRFTSIITTGDTVEGAATLPDGGDWRFGGIPDGLGAFDNGNGTITVLVNHEIFVGTTTATVERAHGAAGSYVSAVVVDKVTLKVTDAYDLADTMYVDPDGDGVWTQIADNMDRLCSADLPAIEAFFWAGEDGIVGTADDLGTRERIFMNGEEFGAEGRAWAFVATGAEARTVWELPSLGKFSWENSVASPDSGKKTVVIGLDDSTPGQVTVYVGDKQATGNTVEKAGLSGGKLFGIKAAGIGNQGTSENIVGTVPETGAFELVEIEDAATKTGAQQDAESDALGVSEFARPEDGAWDTIDPNRFYFATTGGGAAPNRLWALDFVDIENPELGGTFTLLLDGTEGTVSLDNLTVDADGKVWLVEDPGSSTRSAKTWVYDPATDSLDLVAQHDVARFGDIGIPATFPFTTNEEASGIVDVTDLLGDADTQAFLVDVQAHYNIANDPRFSNGDATAGNTPEEVRARAELVEGGQLLVMYVDAVKDGGSGDDVLNGSYEAERIRGKAGDDLIRGGSDADTLVGAGGDDTFEGGAGADVLGGGLGADLFRYGSAAEGGDRIRDFTAEDQIEVSAAGFGGGLVEGALDAAAFVVNDAATVAGGQFVYNIFSGALLWDVDGTGAAEAVLVATLGGSPFVTAGDITVIA